jgi:secreted PhoX family phosphatase
MSLSRRLFLAGAATSAAFGGLRARAQEPISYLNEVHGYGPLRPDPDGIFDLPEGFRYQVVSQAGETMSDGLLVPHKADGMGCFGLDAERVILVRNHELRPDDANFGPLGLSERLRDRLRGGRFYDVGADGAPLPGGATTLVYNLRTRRTERQHLSLGGTAVNCAGGVTPWGSWLSCEEITVKPGGRFPVGKDHGWVFEVPSRARGLVEAAPLRDMGRFQHEAAAVDPRTGVIYMTEDAYDALGLFYRFLPNDRRNPARGGRLQALGFRDPAMGGDSRNRDGVLWREGDWKEVVWIDMDGVDNPDDDLRLRGHRRGAALFGRGEGIFFGRSPQTGAGELYFTCTAGGPSQTGQIMRYVPSPLEGQPGERDQPGRIQLFLEADNPLHLQFPDNLTIAPWGHLFVCEDKYIEKPMNHLKGITPDGRTYTLGRNRFDRQSELAGVCFSPDGTTLFVNIYWPGVTLAITGPWGSLRA